MVQFILTIVLLAQTFVFTGEVPARFNLELLRAEVRAVEPAVTIDFFDTANWNRFPYGPEHPDYPADPELPWTEPARLVFYNVPDEYTREQVRNFILNHIPAETSEEETRRKKVEKLDDLLPDSTAIQDILNRLQTLEGN
jgi:hypothetical protein